MGKVSADKLGIDMWSNGGWLSSSILTVVQRSNATGGFGADLAANGREGWAITKPVAPLALVPVS